MRLILAKMLIILDAWRWLIDAVKEHLKECGLLKKQTGKAKNYKVNIGAKIMNELQKTENRTFSLVPQTLEQAIVMAERWAKSGVVPKQYLNNANAILVA